MNVYIYVCVYHTGIDERRSEGDDFVVAVISNIGNGICERDAVLTLNRIRPVQFQKKHARIKNGEQLTWNC